MKKASDAKRAVYLPPQFALQTGLFGNPVRQIERPAELLLDVVVKSYSKRGITGEQFEHPDGRIIIVVPRKVSPPAGAQLLLVPTGKFPASESDVDQLGQRVRWLTPSAASDVGTATAAETRVNEVVASWSAGVPLSVDSVGGAPGLRAPQVGAVHAVLSHWTVSNDTASIIMPTGTGKTETMLALVVHSRLPRVLIVVPTDPLREQIAGKCQTLGILKMLGIVPDSVKHPVVCVLRKKPKTREEVREIWNASNVVVTTMAVAGGLTSDLLKELAEQASHLILDEAHHVSAPSWTRCRDAFKGKPILQFTATPFRNDGKLVDGKPIYSYPLRKAQSEGYFKAINFRPVTAYDRAEGDTQIAKAALKQLDADLAQGFDHLVMARASSIERAKAIADIYRKIGSTHRPALIHNKLKDSERRTVLSDLFSRRSRVVVCVDMLGEGFDLPALKIAAMHDMHRSLAITLQFTGRFTRTKASLGDATMIANIADANVEESLQELYAEDSDWNLILRQLSEAATGRQAKRSEFVASFEGADAQTMDIAVQNVFPKMSTVVYRTTCKRWNPDAYRQAFKESQLHRNPAISRKQNVLVVVTREVEQVPWGNVRDIQNVTWHMYLLHWDEKSKLLYINSSSNETMHEGLAKAVSGDDVSLVRGEDVFRSLYGLKRIVLSNLGLNHSLSRAVRFTWYVGIDIAQGLSESHLANKTKANIFGRGFEHGGPASIGCSRKGRIWSHKVAGGIEVWKEWCHELGAKLQNSKINFKENILPNVIQPKALEDRPPLLPLSIEWSEVFLDGSEDAVWIEFPNSKVTLVDVGIELTIREESGPIRFRLFTEEESVEFEVRFSGKGDKVRVDYVPLGGAVVTIAKGRSQRAVDDWFQEEPPIIRFANGAFLIYNELCEVTAHDRDPFPKSRIEVRDWAGVDLSKESQTRDKLSDSIQYKMIQEALASGSPAFEIVFDDDTANEAADIVALSLKDDRLLVRLYHCKFSKEDFAGARVKDLYEVCGQAQKSVFWKGDVEYLFDHLARREARQQAKHNVSRFERGDLKVLTSMRKRLRYADVSFEIVIVQPGLSRTKADDSTLDLLASTSLYLKETFGIPLTVIGSD